MAAASGLAPDPVRPHAKSVVVIILENRDYDRVIGNLRRTLY